MDERREIPNGKIPHNGAIGDLASQFRAAMEQAGMEPPREIVADGRLHRFSTDGRPRKKSGWYVLYPSSIVPAGAFGDWRRGISERWRADIGRDLTPEERARYAAQMAEARRQRRIEQEKQHATARRDVAEWWKDAPQATAEHPYLMRKGVQAHGLRLSDQNELLVPMVNGEMHNLQYINPAGTKWFVIGARVEGCYHLIGKPIDKLCIAEGYATAASIFEATGIPSVVAFTTANLVNVAKHWREALPRARIVICADDDIAVEGNPGLTKARQAAEAIRAGLAVPDFGPDRPDKATDFNDLQQHDGPEAVRACIEKAFEPEPERTPEVRLIAGALPEITKAVQEHLLATGLYQRGNKIIWPIPVRLLDAADKPTFVPGLPEIALDQLRLHAMRHIRFLCWSKTALSRSKGDFVPADYTLEQTKALLTLPQFDFPALKAFITTPMVNNDGSIIQEPGYHAAAAVYYDPLGVTYPPVPEKPTRDDALAALQRLKKPFVAYPFLLRDKETKERSIALSVTLAYLITIVNRMLWPRTPGFAFNGNRARVGKGKAVSVGSILVTGQTAATFSLSKTEEEFDKRLVTRMLNGISHIAIDNVARPLDSDQLNEAFTSDYVALRLLGRNVERIVPNIYTITATGNKLVFVGDLTGRWLQADIVSMAERPELETFTFDPVTYAKQHRAELVVAVLTLLKAYIDAGRPGSEKRTLGSFEDWSRDVRGALVWLDEPDPVASMDIIRAADPKGALLARFVELAPQVWKSGFFSPGQLIKAAEDDPSRDLLDLLAEICTKGVSAKSLGWWLRNNADMVVGGKHISAVRDNHTKNWEYQIVQPAKPAKPALFDD